MHFNIHNTFWLEYCFIDMYRLTINVKHIIEHESYQIDNSLPVKIL